MNETIENCLDEAMDLHGLEQVLRGIENAAIRTVAIDTREPSVFSHEILNANPYAYLDDAPLEERRARAVTLRRTLPADAPDAMSILDPAAIAQVAAESWPVVRDADELHDALLTLITVPPVDEWSVWFDELRSAGRSFVMSRGGKEFWCAAEKRELADDVVETLRGWLDCSGPCMASMLAERLAFSLEDVKIALADLEAQGQVLRGRFTVSSADAEIEWCNRRVLARIHRTTLGRLRREVEPVTAVQLHDFLGRWQHLVAGRAASWRRRCPRDHTATAGV